MNSEKVKSKSPERFRIQDFWWGRTDSNHRSEKQQIYSLSPLATRELPHIHLSVRRVINPWHPLWLEPVDGLVQSRCGSVKSSPATLIRVAFNHSSPFTHKLWLEPVDGLEPPTYWLQISCSTNWAIPAAQTEHAYYSYRGTVCQAIFRFFS